MCVIDVDLCDAGDHVLHGVFHGHDVASAIVELVHQRIQRGGLPGPGGPGDEEDAVGLGQKRAQGHQIARIQIEPFEADHRPRLIQYAADNEGPHDVGGDGHANIHRPIVIAQAKPAIHGAAAIRERQVGTGPDAVGDGLAHVARQVAQMAHALWRSNPDLPVVLKSQKMQIGDAVLGEIQKNCVEPLNRIAIRA